MELLVACPQTSRANEDSKLLGVSGITTPMDLSNSSIGSSFQELARASSFILATTLEGSGSGGSCCDPNSDGRNARSCSENDGSRPNERESDLSASVAEGKEVVDLDRFLNASHGERGSGEGGLRQLIELNLKPEPVAERKQMNTKQGCKPTFANKRKGNDKPLTKTNKRFACISVSIWPLKKV